MALSMMCSARPPAALVLTDGDDKAIDLLRSNLADPINLIDTSVVQATPLRWGKCDGGLIDRSFLDWCQTTYSVWSDDASVVLFDCIVAGDVLYKAELPGVFFETAYTLLSEDCHASLWLCHVPRHGVTQNCVVKAASAAGFTVETVESPTCAIRGCPAEDVQRAVIYRMRKARSTAAPS